MDVIEKVKEYCERELYFYQSYGKEKGANLWSLIDRCYGAIMFASSFLEPKDNEALGKWWDDTMRPALYAEN